MREGRHSTAAPLPGCHRLGLWTWGRWLLQHICWMGRVFMSARRDYVLARRACWVESMPGSQRASLMIAVGPYALSGPRALYLERPHRAAYTSLGLAVTCHKLSRHTYYTVQSPRPRLALRSPRSIRLKDIRPGPAGGTNRGDITVLLIVRATTGHIQCASIPPGVAQRPLT